MTVSFATQFAESTSPTLTVASPAVSEHQCAPQHGVGESPLSSNQEAVQGLLASIAKFPLPIQDRAKGFALDGAPGVMCVPLQNTADQCALIDAEDYPLVRGYRWRLQHSARYAIATWSFHGLTGYLRMHRVILMVGPSREVDHKNHDGLDNRKANLRACTHAENMRNGRNPVNGSTGIRGVFQRGDGFVAKVARDGKMHTQKRPTLAEADAAARAMRHELHGEFAYHGPTRAERDDELTFDGDWTLELARRLG